MTFRASKHELLSDDSDDDDDDDDDDDANICKKKTQYNISHKDKVM